MRLVLSPCIALLRYRFAVGTTCCYFLICFDSDFLDCFGRCRTLPFRLWNIFYPTTSSQRHWYADAATNQEDWTRLQRQPWHSILQLLELSKLTNASIGRRSLSAQKKECAACGYPSAKIRKCTLNSRTHEAVFRLVPIFPPRDKFNWQNSCYRQLEREGQAQKDCRHRPHALPQGCVAPFQEWLPDRPAQGCPQRPQAGCLSNATCLGESRERFFFLEPSYLSWTRPISNINPAYERFEFVRLWYTKKPEYKGVHLPRLSFLLSLRRRNKWSRKLHYGKK